MVLKSSGADCLERYKQYIESGATIVASPRKVYGPENNDLSLQLKREETGSLSRTFKIIDETVVNPVRSRLNLAAVLFFATKIIMLSGNSNKIQKFKAIQQRKNLQQRQRNQNLRTKERKLGYRIKNFGLVVSDRMRYPDAAHRCGRIRCGGPGANDDNPPGLFLITADDKKALSCLKTRCSS
ncbi:MAG: hypothetical protein PVI27_05120 [Desulfobacteraceae bacterium]|jgi:hypothetical protein